MTIVTLASDISGYPILVQWEGSTVGQESSRLDSPAS